MAKDLIATGDRCFVEEDFDGAVTAYSEALKVEPSNARLYEARANAYLKLEQYHQSNADATRALELDPQLSKAYLRKGVALFSMEEYEAAREAFELGQQIASDNAFKIWIRKCDAELEDEAETSQAKHAKGNANGTARAPAPAEPAHAAPAAAPAPAAAAPEPAGPPPPAAQATAPAAPSTSAAAPAWDAAPSLTPAMAASLAFEGKYRHQHYQLQNKITVDVYAKKLKKEQVSVDFQETHMTIIINDLEGNEEYKLDVELYGKVVPDKCKYEVLTTKVEVTLVKADDVQWGSLERSDKVAAPNYSTPGTDAPRQYPSSYRKQPKDWDKVDAELSTLEQKGELDSGDPLNSFFKKIFSQGDEDTRRAMMKSFVESNGTVLSTNWDDVGKKKVECTPPDGMAVNKWEQ